MSVWPGNRTLFLLVHTSRWCGGVTPSLLALGAALGSGWRQVYTLVSDSVSLSSLWFLVEVCALGRVGHRLW